MILYLGDNSHWLFKATWKTEITVFASSMYTWSSV